MSGTVTLKPEWRGVRFAKRLTGFEGGDSNVHSEVANKLLYKSKGKENRYVYCDDEFMNLEGTESEALIEILQDCVMKGEAIYFNGETSDDMWRIKFDGEGDHVIQSAHIEYEDAFEVFLNMYEEKLSKKMCKDLRKLREAIRIGDAL
jgi:hypothetical protein